MVLSGNIDSRRAVALTGRCLYVPKPVAAATLVDALRRRRDPIGLFVEAYGLWRERPWAEWFALISGTLYVPFEAYELVRRVTAVHLAVLLINLGIVFYMLYLRLTARKEAETTA